MDPISVALDIGSKLIDRLWPDPTQAAAAKLELMLRFKPHFVTLTTAYALRLTLLARKMGIQPQKGALAVLTTTLLAPLLIPFYLGMMLYLTGLA